MNLIFLFIFFILYLIIFYKEDFIDMKKLKIKNKDENPIFKSNISLDVNDSIYAPKYCLYHPTDKSQAICFDENDLFNNPNTSIGRSNINNNIKKIKDKLTFYKSKGFHSENDKQHWMNTKNNIEKNWRDGEKEPRICLGNTCLTQDDIRPIYRSNPTKRYRQGPYGKSGGQMVEINERVFLVITVILFLS